ncbi:hypothetical protein FS749_003166 [Ceratobasidium sp. UAMH 11750]|nr:hypothetical protein FS749_003166 [Ceratobasidium sp. UAMH 11750]
MPTTTMSSSIFELPELILHVNTYLEPYHSVCLACSSRSMFYTIMPRLWKHVRGMSQIFALFPVAEGLDQGAVVQPGNLSEVDYSRLGLYAPWVEHLTLNLSESDTSTQAASMLRYYSSTRVLLPNLRFIATTSDPRLVGIGVSWFMSLLSPSLVSLDLIPTSYIEFLFPPLPVLLHALSTNCPNLHTLALIPNPGSEFPGMMSYFLESATSDYASKIEDLLKHGPGPALALLCPLISFTIPIGVLDHFCWDVISAWPLLERLELIADPKDPSCSLPEIAESAFPSLRHLALHIVNAQIDTFNVLWSVPALVHKLTSVKVVPAGRLCTHRANYFLLYSLILPVLVEQSPCVQDLWLDVRDPRARNTSHLSPIFTLDILRQLPLRTLHIEGLYLMGHANIPGYLVENFPRLKKFTLPNQGITVCLATPDARTAVSES